MLTLDGIAQAVAITSTVALTFAPLQNEREIPREISSDALAFVLEQEVLAVGKGSSLVGAWLETEGSVRWYVDGKEAAVADLLRLEPEKVLWIKVDPAPAASIWLHHSDMPTDWTDGMIKLVRSSRTIAAGSERSAKTLYFLGNLLASGDDIARLGGRRAELERQLSRVRIMSPAAVSDSLGTPVAFTFVRAGATGNARAILFGAR